MSLTNYSVTRETLDKLAEHGILRRYEEIGGDHSWMTCGLVENREVAFESGNLRTYNHATFTHACLAVIEANKWRVEFCYDKYDDKWSAEIEVVHGIWIAKPTLPEALAKALT